MRSFKNKIETLRTNLKNNKEGKKRELDPRFVPFFKLNDAEKMTVRFFPITEEDLFVSYKVHGPKLKNKEIQGIRCSRDSGDSKCAVCEFTYGLWQTGEEDQKNEAKRWFPKETFLGTCVVLESDIEVPDTEDGNPVKLIYLPLSIKEKLEVGIISGLVDDPCDRDFVIFATKKPNQYASYDNSFFKGVDSPLSADIVTQFDAGEAYYHDASEHFPKLTTYAETKVWLDDALQKENGTSSGEAVSESEKKEEDPKPVVKSEESPQRTVASDLRAKLNRNRGA